MPWLRPHARAVTPSRRRRGAPRRRRAPRTQTARSRSASTTRSTPTPIRARSPSSSPRSRVTARGSTTRRTAPCGSRAESEVGSDFVPYMTAGHWTYDDDDELRLGLRLLVGLGAVPLRALGPREPSRLGVDPGRTYSGAWVVVAHRLPATATSAGRRPAPTWYWYNGYAVGWTFGYSPYYSYCHHDHLYSPRLGGYVVRGSDPRAREYEARTRPYVAALPSVGGGRGSRCGQPDRRWRGAGGRIAASPRVGPRPSELGMRPESVAAPPAGHAGLARAQALAAPHTAVAAGAAPPVQARRRRAFEPDVAVSAAAAPRAFDNRGRVTSRNDAVARAPQFQGVNPSPPRQAMNDRSAVESRQAPRSLSNGPTEGRAFGLPSASAPTYPSYRSAPSSPPSAFRPSSPSAPPSPAFRSTPSSAPSQPTYHASPSQPAFRSAPTPSQPTFRSGVMPGGVQLIAYADRLGGRPAAVCARLLDGPLAGAFGGVHVLPFFHPIRRRRRRLRPDRPHRGRPALGTWDDVAALAARTRRDGRRHRQPRLRRSAAVPGLRRARRRRRRTPGMFLTFARVFPDGATEDDLLALVPAAPGPALHADGWATASACSGRPSPPQQIDIDVHAPGARPTSRGARRLATAGVTTIRLDAVGYAVKTAGHHVLHDAGDASRSSTRSTAQAHASSASRSSSRSTGTTGSRSRSPAQVDWVYDFALPPLVLHALTRGDTAPLRRWLAMRPRNAITVLDTHDGIGVVDVGPDARAGGGLLSTRADRRARRDRSTSTAADAAVATARRVQPRTCTRSTAPSTTRSARDDRVPAGPAAFSSSCPGSRRSTTSACSPAATSRAPPAPTPGSQPPPLPRGRGRGGAGPARGRDAVRLIRLRTAIRPSRGSSRRPGPPAN